MKISLSLISLFLCSMMLSLIAMNGEWDWGWFCAVCGWSCVYVMEK